VESPDKVGQAKKMPKSEVLATDPALPLLLIVEDSLPLTQVLNHYLSKYYRIVFAENGQKGLEKAQEQVPDMVICDLMMPEMDGFEFCAVLRANPYTSHIPVVILTAFTDEESRIKVLEAGANVVLTKPVNPGILRQQLKNLLQLRLQMHALVVQEQEAKNKAEHLESVYQQSELIFMEKMMDLIAARYDDPNFSVADIQRALNFSKSQLHRKLVSISGYPGSHFIREYRLKEAKKLLLADPNLSVADVAYQVGYTDPNYFSRAFSAEFGKSPSKIRE
jgi:CheY-like chemotaxis protein